MSTYGKIQTAFKKFCDSWYDRQSTALNTARSIQQLLQSEGKIPPDRLKLFPHTEKDTNKQGNYFIAGATNYDPQKKYWILGLVLVVMFPDENVVLPKDNLMVCFGINPLSSLIKVTLENSDLACEFIPTQEEVLRKFIVNSLAKIEEFYLSSQENFYDRSEERFLAFNLLPRA